MDVEEEVIINVFGFLGTTLLSVGGRNAFDDCIITAAAESSMNDVVDMMSVRCYGDCVGLDGRCSRTLSRHGPFKFFEWV